MGSQPLGSSQPSWYQMDQDCHSNETDSSDLRFNDFMSYPSLQAIQEHAWRNTEISALSLKTTDTSCYWMHSPPNDCHSTPAPDLSPTSSYLAWSQSSDSTSPEHQEYFAWGSSRSSKQAPINQQEKQTSHVLPALELDAPTHHDSKTNTLNYHFSRHLSTDTSEMKQASISSPHCAPSTKTNQLISFEDTEDEKGNRVLKLEPETSQAIAGHTNQTTGSGKRWKAAHRAVERRYRSNLNLKIVKLARCIPEIHNQAVIEEEMNQASGDRRYFPKAKLQKGHVLSEAVNHIEALHRRVTQLEAEKARLDNTVKTLQMNLQGKLRPYHQPFPGRSYSCVQ